MKKVMMAALALLGMTVAGPAMAQQGCGVGVLAGYTMGQVDTGGPIGIGSQGQKIGAQVSCDVRMGTYMVAGAFASYEAFLGNIKTVGLKDEWNLGGRVGVLAHPGTLVYGHASWSHVSTDLVGSVDGWKLGPGIEVALPNTPLTLDLRVAYGTYDKVGGMPIEAHTTEAKLILSYKFGAPPALASAPLK